MMDQKAKGDGRRRTGWQTSRLAGRREKERERTIITTSFFALVHPIPSSIHPSIYPSIELFYRIHTYYTRDAVFLFVCLLSSARWPGQKTKTNRLSVCHALTVGGRVQGSRSSGSGPCCLA